MKTIITLLSVLLLSGTATASGVEVSDFDLKPISANEQITTLAYRVTLTNTSNAEASVRAKIDYLDGEGFLLHDTHLKYGSIVLGAGESKSFRGQEVVLTPVILQLNRFDITIED